MVKITVTGVGDKPIEVNSVDEAFEIIRSEEFYRAIGEFIFRFSQLEYLIKSALASYLKLRDGQFDAVVRPSTSPCFALSRKRRSSWTSTLNTIQPEVVFQ